MKSPIYEQCIRVMKRSLFKIGMQRVRCKHFSERYGPFQSSSMYVVLRLVFSGSALFCQSDWHQLLYEKKTLLVPRFYGSSRLLSKHNTIFVVDVIF